MCALKGLATAMTSEAMCWPLAAVLPRNRSETAQEVASVGRGGEQALGGEEAPLLVPGRLFNFLTDGALAFGCRQVRSALYTHVCWCPNPG